MILDGPRGAGKTTSAERMARSSVLLPRDMELLRVDAEALLRSLEPPVLIDEWQLAGTDVLWAIKRVVDSGPRPGQFILTGSVEPASYGPTYPLTRRAVRLLMRPMTHSELEGRGAETVFLERAFACETPRLGDGAEPFSMSWLENPGLPGARGMADARLFFEAYASLVSQGAGDEGRDASRLMRTMRVLATLEAQALPDQRLWQAADINKATWKGYEDLLTRVHLSAPAPAFESNRLNRLTTYPKRFLSDVALALTLADVDGGALGVDAAIAGRYLESFVMQQLRPQVDRVRGALYHLRTAAGEREVDAVVEVGTRVLAFEVKHGVRPTATDARHLKWLRDGLGERFAQGYVVHTGTETYPLGERVTALPITVLMG